MKQRYYNHKVILNYMEGNEISINKFCKMCKISHNQYKRILNDDNVNIAVLYRISQVLAIPFYEMFIVENYNMFSGIELYK